MNNKINYRGYTAKIEFSAEDNLLVGRLIGIRDEVTFHGEPVQEINDAMKDSVDFHIEISDALLTSRKNLKSV